jgi:hypothetical protein
LTAGPARAQISNLPEAIREKLQANSGGETFRLFAPLLAAAPKAGITVTRDQAYGSDPQQTLDVYQPRDARDLPILVYVHGGVLTAGDKNETNEISANVLYYFARHGSTHRPRKTWVGFWHGSKQTRVVMVGIQNEYTWWGVHPVPYTLRRGHSIAVFMAQLAQG